MGIFQLESAGMREVLKQMIPNKFEDIIALVALYRPGPMQNIPAYNNRKHGLEEPDYLHPKIESILKETYGVIIYQEQVMQIAQALSGFSAGKADILRKAMGKKKSAEMDRQKKDFIEGAIKNDIPKEQAVYIFQLVEKFAQYGFNKSHAAAYALIAYQTAYIKTHYPLSFFSASMSMEMSNTDKLNQFYEELKRLSISHKVTKNSAARHLVASSRGPSSPILTIAPAAPWICFLRNRGFSSAISTRFPTAVFAAILSPAFSASLSTPTS